MSYNGIANLKPNGIIKGFSKETNKSIPTFVEPINCKNCGAPNRIYKCSYCGT